MRGANLGGSFLQKVLRPLSFPRMRLIAVAPFSDGSDGGRIELILARNQNSCFGSDGDIIRAFARVDIGGRDHS